MRFSLKRIPTFLGLLGTALIAGCSQSVLSSGSPLPSSIVGKSFSSKTMVVARASNDAPETIVTYLKGAPEEPLRFPATILKGTYGTRTNPTLPVPMDLFVKTVAVDRNFLNGDFYYEAPVLGVNGELNSVTTALSLWVRYRYNEVPSVSRDTWTQMIQMIETNCTNCVTRSTSEILSLIKNSPELSGNLDFTLRNGCPIALSLNPTGLPEMIWVYADPVFAPGSTTDGPLTVIKEASVIEINLLFLKINSSTEKTFADEWTAKKNSVTYNTVSAPSYIWELDYSSSGLHDIIAKKTFSTGVVYYGFHFDVGNTNRSPIFAAGTRLIMRAQKENRLPIPITTVADPDGDGVSFSLSGAVNASDNIFGLSISAGDLLWTPVAHPGFKDDQLGLHRVRLVATDNSPDPQSIAGEIEILVVDDSPPEVIATGDWNLTEGASSDYTFTVKDAENDRVCLRLDAGTRLVTSSLPLGSGLVTFAPTVANPSDQAPCFTIVGGSRTFKMSLTPSYMQAVGGNSSLNVNLTANYSTNDGYIELPVPPQTSVKLNVTNVDDPPTWLQQPNSNIILNETVAFTSSGGWATDAALNATAVRFYLINVNTGACKEMFSGLTSVPQADGTTLDEFTSFNMAGPSINIAGTPGFETAPTCTFKIRAVDNVGLFADTEEITYNVTNLNRPVCWYYDGNGACPASDPFPSATVHVSERGKFTQIIGAGPDDVTNDFLDLSLVFKDPDEKDEVDFECLDCDAKGLAEGTYEMRNKMGMGEIGSFRWNPGYGAANSIGSLTLTFRAKDIAGTSVTKAVTLVIDAAPAPMKITMIDPNTVPVDSGMTVVLQEPPEPPLTPNPPSASTYHLKVVPMNSDPVNLYNYRMTFTRSSLRAAGMSVINVVNNCDTSGNYTYSFVGPTLMKTHIATSVSTNILASCPSGFEFDVVYSLNNTDGDTGSVNVGYKNYSDFTVTVTRVDGFGNDDATTSQFHSWNLRALNLNRSIKTLGISNNGATAAKNDLSAPSTDFNLSLSAAQVLGNTGPAIAARTISMYANDLDATNDFFSYSISSNIAGSTKVYSTSFTQTPVGTQAASFTLNPGCFSSAAGIQKMNLTVTVSDGRGKQVTRMIRLSLSNVTFIPNLPTCR